MRELHFQSRWFERCLRDYLGIEDRPITEEDVQEIRYLLVSTTHSYELGFAKSLPPELFQTCAFQDSGDEWDCACIENTGQYASIQDFLEIEVSNLEIGYQVHELRLKQEIACFEYDGSPVSYQQSGWLKQADWPGKIMYLEQLKRRRGLSRASSCLTQRSRPRRKTGRPHRPLPARPPRFPRSRQSPCPPRPARSRTPRRPWGACARLW